MKYIRRLKNIFWWVVKDGGWILSGPLFLLFLLPILVSIFEGQIAVVVLKVLGVIIICVGYFLSIYGMSKKIQELSDDDESGISKLYKDWWAKRPWTEAKLDLSAPIFNVGQSVAGEIKTGINRETATTDEKVEYLLKEMDKRVDVERSLRNDINLLRGKHKEVSKRLSDRLTELKKNTKSVLIGDVEKEYFGGLIFIIGLLFTSFPVVFLYYGDSVVQFLLSAITWASSFR